MHGGRGAGRLVERVEALSVGFEAGWRAEKAVSGEARVAELEKQSAADHSPESCTLFDSVHEPIQGVSHSERQSVRKAGFSEPSSRAR